MKERLDTLLVKKGFYESREKAKAAIMAGLVFVDGRISDKPGMPIKEEQEITLKEDPCPYVSRGGLKLEKAIKSFSIDLTEKISMDIGASTGGFTDCMLLNGATKVYAVDVGYGQLAWKLRNDPRVINIERCNFRYFDEELVPEGLDFISIDVSFISLDLILPKASSMLKEGGHIVCLVKPQFEAGREQVGKKGIVRDPSVHREVIEKVITSADALGLDAIGLDFSPITGAKGNIEYLLLLNKRENKEYNEDCVRQIVNKDFIEEIVEKSHQLLS